MGFYGSECTQETHTVSKLFLSIELGFFGNSQVGLVLVYLVLTEVSHPASKGKT